MALLYILSTAVSLYQTTASTTQTATTEPSTSPSVTTATSTVSTTPMACSSPSGVSFATYVVNSTHATYTCNTGYSMTGDATISCVGGVWTGGYPTCNYIQSANDIDTNVTVNSDTPTWLLILIAVLAGILCLLLLTCVLWCCLHICGCLGGPIFGSHVHPEMAGESGCRCCRKRRRSRRRGYDSRRSSIVEVETPRPKQEIRIAGFNYSKQNKNSFKNATPDSGLDSRDETTPRMVQTVQELIYNEKRNKAPKDLKDKWMPHANPVRHNNTSTK